jgi:hypothetical protein
MSSSAADKWYVATPTNKLEKEMWGKEGPPEMEFKDLTLKIRIASRVLKQRSGLGKFAIRKSWVQRWLVLAGQRLFYFELSNKIEQELIGYPPWLDYAVANYEDGQGLASHDDKQIVSDKHKLPRGIMDLLEDEVLFDAAYHPEASGKKSKMLFSIDFQKTRGDHLEKWKVCFESEAEQHEWLEALHEVVGIQEDGIHDHGFEPGDHIIRWELVPIAWPIQIHGIVLEAGKNCVIIADFGMTAQVDGKAVKILEEDETGEENNEIMRAAWSQFRPKEKQRLNVKVLTDKAELKKWTKVNYGRNIFDFSSSGGKFGKLTKWFRTTPKRSTDDDLVSDKGYVGEDWLEEAMQCSNISSSGENGQDSAAVLKPPPVFSLDEFAPDDVALSQDSLLRASVDALNRLDEEIKDEDKIPQIVDAPLDKLPKADPTKIVLARTNFLLEFGEDILPPYHIFYSNSECIAVWCKTGRWSTLQAAIFLHSTAIGNAKSATFMTIGVAAAHMVLLPVLAVGGLAMVTAPFIILKRSKEKWEMATNQLNDSFWAWAEPEVFVAAIENWSGLHS